MNNSPHCSHLYFLSPECQLQVDLFASISADTSATRFCELETRSRGDGNRCLHIGLEAIWGVCKPTLELGGQSTVTGQGAEGTPSPSGPCMEVSNPPGDGNPGTPSVTSQSRIDPAEPQGQ